MNPRTTQLLLAVGLTTSLCASASLAADNTPHDPGAAAVAASDVLDAHCADAAAAAATRSAEAAGAVVGVLARVSSAHDATRAVYLLYWRGRLNLCLDREERAQSDFEAFLAESDGEAGFSDQQTQARKLLRLIHREKAGGPSIQTPPLAAAGGALLGVAGALGGISAWQWQEVQNRRTEFEAGLRDAAETRTIAEQGLESATASGVLLGSAIGSGVAGAASLLLSTVRPQSPGALTTLLVPAGPDAWAVVVAGEF